LVLQGFLWVLSMKDIGQRFIEIRKKLGMTQKEFADQLGVSSGAIQGYEYGKIPKGEVMLKLLEMGYDLNWLVGGTGKMYLDQAAIEPAKQGALDRMIVWNVAYFLCKRRDDGDDPEDYADSFMEIYEAMLTKSRQAESKEADKDDNIVNFTLRRLGMGT